MAGSRVFVDTNVLLAAFPAGAWSRFAGAIAASYRAHLQVMAALKDVRDHSRLNGKTPIISAGLADGGLPGKKPGQKLDGVSIPATVYLPMRKGSSLRCWYPCDPCGRRAHVRLMAFMIATSNL
jgi:hypothetical protein